MTKMGTAGRTDSRHCSRQLAGWYANRYREVLICFHDDVLTVRHSGWDIEEFEKFVEPTRDLASMTALFVAKLIPVGVYADALENDHPEVSRACQFMRDWEQP